MTTNLLGLFGKCGSKLLGMTSLLSTISSTCSNRICQLVRHSKGWQLSLGSLSPFCQAVLAVSSCAVLDASNCSSVCILVQHSQRLLTVSAVICANGDVDKSLGCCFFCPLSTLSHCRSALKMFTHQNQRVSGRQCRCVKVIGDREGKMKSMLSSSVSPSVKTVLQVKNKKRYLKVNLQYKNIHLFRRNHHHFVSSTIELHYHYLNLSDDRQPINVCAIFEVLLPFCFLARAHTFLAPCIRLLL